ncbi:hypothetical protein RCL_jg13996.t1 [Rhizophagus clarus]|uniref:Uncharacterized protein n=1 Tax=Rhizophagus clarus TaxID=94130 RepID=A0A8H3QTM9_9GLOM|nr:hypothetical protein RCL_jg13996.t1 [Rhizophagus clarus]
MQYLKLEKKKEISSLVILTINLIIMKIRILITIGTVLEERLWILKTHLDFKFIRNGSEFRSKALDVDFKFTRNSFSTLRTLTRTLNLQRMAGTLIWTFS